MGLDRKIRGQGGRSGTQQSQQQQATVLRMMKIREKISGTRRSEEHARIFCDLRSVISSVRKQDAAIIDSLDELVTSPDGLAAALVRS